MSQGHKAIDDPLRLLGFLSGQREVFEHRSSHGLDLEPISAPVRHAFPILRFFIQGDQPLERRGRVGVERYDFEQAFADLFRFVLFAVNDHLFHQSAA